MSSSALALHDAMIGALTSSAPLIERLGAARIFDQAPKPAPYPYVTLGQTVTRTDDTDTTPSDTHTVTLHVWSRARGRSETQDIIATIRDALHDQPLALAGHKLINLRNEFCEARRDPDGVTFHGIARFRAVTEPL